MAEQLKTTRYCRTAAWPHAFASYGSHRLRVPDRHVHLLGLPEDLTVDGGLLTPTFKVRRRLVEERFQEVIEALYAEAAADG